MPSMQYGWYVATTFSTLAKSSAAFLYTTSSDSALRSGMSRKILSTLCLPSSRPPVGAATPASLTGSSK